MLYNSGGTILRPRVDLLFHCSLVLSLQKLLDCIAEDAGAWIIGTSKLQKVGTTNDPRCIMIYSYYRLDMYNWSLVGIVLSNY